MTHFLPEKDNFLALPENFCHPDRAGVVVLSVPFEATSTYGHGSSQGPAAILSASHEVELFDAALGFEAYVAAGGIATLPALDVAGCEGEALARRVCEETGRWIAGGKFVITLGGEHTSVVGAIRAHCEVYDDLTVVQLDAHSDLRPEYLGTQWNHACAMARVLDFHDAVVPVGIRSQDADERALSQQRALPVFYAHDIHGRPSDGPDWVAQVINATRRRVYITFDCDVVDPSILPGTGTPEPGGLTWQQIDALFAGLCAEREVVGLDVSELAPIPGMRHSEFTAAKLIYRLIGYRFPRKRAT